MTNQLGSWATDVRRLDDALAALRPAAAHLGVAMPDGREWFELLRHKLLAQLEARPMLVVGIVGGTNIGKSVLFNHLAGEIASAVSPLAAGTKHPVCLVPDGCDDPAMLAGIFDAFELRAWGASDDPLRESPRHLLFWRTGRNVPERLLLLDAPDVDSDARVNWKRARAIRQSADVILAVLTQQKYNDAVVKQFFREAVEADKPVVVLFNQVDLEADRTFWPQWLDTFRRQTGADPELVYVIPHNRKAAESLGLSFYDVGRDGLTTPDGPANLRDELASLHFDAIKIRTFRGAVRRILDPQEGAPAWLDKLRDASDEFAGAGEVLSASEMARVAWPSLPTSILVGEIRQWWDAHRSGWSRNVHGFYRNIFTKPVRKVWESIRPSTDPLEVFQRRESEGIVQAVRKLLDELERLAQVGNDTLRPRLQRLLGGRAREKLLTRVREAHAELPAVDEDYRRFLQDELDRWKTTYPRALRVLRSVDQAAAIARPAITVALLVTGWGVAGDLVGQAGQFAAEAAITGGITGGGEALVATTTEGMHQAAGQLFRRLQTTYAKHRASWLASWLETELLGELLTDLRRGAEIPTSAPFSQVEAALTALDC